MVFFDVEQVKGYTITPNYHQRDKTISLKAKGLLSQMFSLPSDWDYTLKGLSYLNLEGVDSIRTAVQELERAGYIERIRIRDETGRYRGSRYLVYATPKKSASDAPVLEDPMQGSPTAEESAQTDPTQLKKELAITEPPNKEERNIESIKSSHVDCDENRHDEIQSHWDSYEDIIRTNIEYPYLVQAMPEYQDRLQEILELIVETVSTIKTSIRVGGVEYPADVVRQRLLKLGMEHIQYVLNCLDENTTKIRNIRQYLLTALYHAPTTMNNYYASLVRHEQYGENTHER